MKKIQNLFIVFLLFASLFVIQGALAEETEEVSVISEQIEEEQVPSAFRYGWEKFKLYFVQNESIKAEKEMQLARWKVAEARVEAQKGNIEKAEKAMQENEKMLVRAQKRISKLDNLTPGLENAIRVHEERMSRLNVSLQNANLSEQQRTRIESQIGNIDNVTKILEQNRQRIQSKIQEHLNLSEEDLDSIMQQVQNQTQKQAGKN